MITSRIYGNELLIDTAFYGHDGEFVGAEAVRLPDRQRRTYLLHQMRADGGIDEIMTALEGAPVKEEWSPE